MRFNPWSEFPEIEKFFEMPMVAPKNFIPPIDIYDKKESIVVETPVAGVDPKKVNISIENDVLTIEGSVEKKIEVDEKNYYRKEVRVGSFHRSVALPTAVDGEKANAEYTDGILTITIPKAERAKPKTITVKAKK